MLASDDGSLVVVWLRRCLISPSNVSPRFAANWISSLSLLYSPLCATSNSLATSSVPPVPSSTDDSHRRLVKSSSNTETVRVWLENCSNVCSEAKQDIFWWEETINSKSTKVKNNTADRPVLRKNLLKWLLNHTFYWDEEYLNGKHCSPFIMFNHLWYFFL